MNALEPYRKPCSIKPNCTVFETPALEQSIRHLSACIYQYADRVFYEIVMSEISWGYW